MTPKTNKPLSPGRELFLSALINVVFPALILALFCCLGQSLFGADYNSSGPFWVRILSYFMSRSLSFYVVGLLAISALGILGCLYLWRKKGTSVRLWGQITPLLAFYGGTILLIFLLIFWTLTRRFWIQLFDMIVAFIASI